MSRINPVQLQKFLKGVDYPADKAALIENAKKMGADENVCASLEELPDEEFQTPVDVSQALAQLSEVAEQDSANAESSTEEMSSESNDFLTQAAQDSLAELELCKLALKKTKDEEVKTFAQQMIDEHGQIEEEIKQMADKRNFELPEELIPEHQSLIEQLSKTSGKDFDQQFMKHNVKEHEKDIKIFKQYAEQEEDAEIRELAEKGVEMLSHHLNRAKEIERRLGGRP